MKVALSRQRRFWRARVRRGLCPQCGERRALPGITRCARCQLMQRRYLRQHREHRAWRKGGPGARPRYTDAQLRRLAKTRRR